MSDQKTTSHAKVGLICGGIAAGMLGLAFASVPLYDLFCRVTGYGGTTQRVESASGEIVDRVMEVRFDSNVAPGVNWSFKPEVRTVKVKLGESRLINYVAVNEGDEPMTATATFNVAPPVAGSYFNKIECFCFTEQKLEPGEKIVMPVMFYLDPDLIEDADMTEVSSVTLSYTFFPLPKKDEAPKPVASLSEGGDKKPL